jgi:hypothetical protein
VVVTTSGNHAETGGQNIEEWSGVAVKAVQTQQHGSGRKCKLCGIVVDHLGGTQQLPTIISVACPPNVPRN